MRKIFCILHFTFYILLFISCDSKWDQNGDLYGMWQLTEWRDASNDIKATKADGIYYCVQLNLLKLRKTSQSEYYLSYFTHTGDSLLIGRTVKWPQESNWPADTTCALTDLAPLGVPTDGKFHIDVLNNDCMVLSSTQGTVSFRKY